MSEIELVKLRRRICFEEGSGGDRYRAISTRLRQLRDPDQAARNQRERRKRPEVKRREYFNQLKYLAEHPEAREKAKVISKRYYDKNKEAIHRKRSTPSHKWVVGFMRSLQHIIHRKMLGLPTEWVPGSVGARPSPRISHYLGCTRTQFLAHLEAHFKAHLTWENYGTDWWLGHVKPIRDFDCTKEADRLDCFRYTNLLPEPVRDNLMRVNEIRKNLEDHKYQQEIIRFKRGAERHAAENI
jgi:hypothetical protein